MARRKKITDTPPEEARKASSSFSGFGLTELELEARERTLPAGCSVAWVGRKGPGWVEFLTWPDGQLLRAQYEPAI